MRILVTADLHLEHTGPEPIRRLVAGMDRENPDLVVLAGDLGNPARLFEQCLCCFLKLDCPVAVVPGNHDIWASLGETSIALYEEILPGITRSVGFHWVDRSPLILPNGIAIAGNIGWYDYSSREPSYPQTIEEIIAQKPSYAADAQFVNWEFSDIEFAERCRLGLQKQMLELEENPAVEKVLVATHVPIFENQIERQPDNEDWSLGNPYFGHLTMGESVRGFRKLRWVVSGHTHVGQNGIIERPGMPTIATSVVDSDYGRPRWVEVEI